MNVNNVSIEQQYEKLFEIPFNSTNKYMLTPHMEKQTGAGLLIVKGAPDRLIKYCANLPTQFQQHWNSLMMEGKRCIMVCQMTIDASMVNHPEFRAHLKGTSLEELAHIFDLS